MAAGEIRFILGDDHFVGAPPTPYTQGSYHLLADVYDPAAADTCRLYYDGLLLTRGQRSVNVAGQNGHIGYDPFGGTMEREPTGNIAHLSVYDAPLSRADIENVYDKFLHG